MSDSLIPSSVGLEWEGDQGGNTAHPAPNVYSTFQKLYLVNPQGFAVSLKQFNFQQKETLMKHKI
jgi:hypothetical protein